MGVLFSPRDQLELQAEQIIIRSGGWSSNRWHTLPRGLCDAASQAGAETDGVHDTGEKMVREKFSENLQMVEDIITTIGDENQLEKSTSEATGFKKFLFSSLEALDIDVTDYIGNLEMNSIKQLGRLARGEDRLSPYYDIAADAIIAVANILFDLF